LALASALQRLPAAARWPIGDFSHELTAPAVNPNTTVKTMENPRMNSRMGMARDHRLGAVWSAAVSTAPSSPSPFAMITTGGSQPSWVRTACSPVMKDR